MWKAISHSNTNQANIARRMLQNIGAEHIVVIDSVQTVIELAVPNKGLNSKKRKKKAKDNNARFNHIMKETSGYVSSHHTSPLTLADFSFARCGLGIITKKLSNHQGSCRRCREILEPTPVNSMTSRHTGAFKLPEAQQEISNEARKINLANSMEPVSTRTMVGTLDLTNADIDLPVVSEEDTYSEILTAFREALIKKSDAVVDRYAELVTQSNQLIKQAEVLENEAQSELFEMDSEILRRQKELEQLIEERDIKTGRAS